VASQEPELRHDAETLPAVLAASVREHPYYVGLSVVLAWLVALVVALVTPTQFESEVTIRIGQVGVVEAVQRKNSVRWVTDAYPLEASSALAGRLFGERGEEGAGGAAEGTAPVIYGVRFVEESDRALRIIARAASAEAASSFLKSVAERVLDEHAALLADARAMQDAAQEALRLRVTDLQHMLNTKASNAGTGEQLSQEMALITLLELQLQQARGPVLTHPSAMSGIDSAAGGPVAPRTGRNFAVASLAGMFLGFAIALFLRGLRRALP